ncbi:unnamed protein product [Ambrosiozyma monospora]|uniref:GTP-binding protein n=1 Tax=Ambrosiozyma monospora TaxID=43982 RepID=A0A9W6TB54_AMBMO|nr:unnamed protein product [Ambrosiozyma monospora]
MEGSSEEIGNNYYEAQGTSLIQFDSWQIQNINRSGKSSIRKVVFHNMKPIDTLYLDSTAKPTSELYKSLIDLDVMELPGQLDIFEPELYNCDELFASTGALVYVIDSQDEYLASIENLLHIINYVYALNKNINVEVLIHKMDGSSEDFKMDTQRDIRSRITTELANYGSEEILVNFHVTSIFDHTIYEAFSKIVQRLIIEYGALENICDMLMEATSLDKVYLFDINSKIYIATDSSANSLQTYEACAEFIDVNTDLIGLYEEDDNETEDVNGYEPTKGGEDTGENSALALRTTRCFSELQNGTALVYYKAIRGLGLVAIVRTNGDFQTCKPVIDHNLLMFKRALERIWERERIEPSYE